MAKLRTRLQMKRMMSCQRRQRKIRRCLITTRCQLKICQKMRLARALKMTKVPPLYLSRMKSKKKSLKISKRFDSCSQIHDVLLLLRFFFNFDCFVVAIECVFLRIFSELTRGFCTGHKLLTKNCFWCSTKLLTAIQRNYGISVVGIRRAGNK